MDDVAPDGTERWLTIGLAARAAGVSRRTAFRWASLGIIPVRQAGTRRCIEVGALHRLTLNRVPAARVQPLGGAEAANSPSPTEADTLAALSEGLVVAQEMTNSLFNRVARLERLAGLSSS